MTVSKHKFQSSPSLEAGSYKGLTSSIQHSFTFQSSPSLEAGSYDKIRQWRKDRERVPILSQPGGRELHWSDINGNPLLRFQSSPSLEAGSYYKTTYRTHKTLYQMFQSSPSLEAGSYFVGEAKCYNSQGFQSSPSLEAGSYLSGQNEAFEQLVVPILSQPGGRELPIWPSNPNSARSRFQSSPSLEAGSYLMIPWAVSATKMFQSSPSLEAGSYDRFSHYSGGLWTEFQSSPSLEAGSYDVTDSGDNNAASSNPLPAWRPGATLLFLCRHPGQPGSNPLPAWRPGATSRRAHHRQ